jgi:DNA primase
VRFDDNFLDELKSRLRLSDVIGKTVKLRRQGREYAGLSPFTKEKSPSFFVNDDKGFYHDFSSGKHGDLIDFLQETERLSFVEAVERLAGEAGMALPELDPRTAEIEKKQAGLIDWLETAAAWFEAELRRPAGREAREYLIRRGLPEEEWKRFRLGYAPPGRTTLKDYLVAKGAHPASLVDAGVLIAPEDGGAPYDRFRQRIIFPIADGRGRVVSFGGRALDPEARAKYLNGTETQLFHKGRVLYGLPEARKLLHAGGEAVGLVVVEGYMDVIACQRAGVAAVASMGTALTEEQMEALWRLHSEPTLCFDSDAAGQRAVGRSVDRALPLLKPGRSFKFTVLTGGKDADDVLRDEGPEKLKSQLSNTSAFVQKLFERERDLDRLDTPERRAGLKVRLRQAAAAIQDKDLREQYRDDLLDQFFLEFPRVRFVPGWGKKVEASTALLVKDAAERLRSSARNMHASLAVAAIDEPAWLLPYVEEFAIYGFGDDRLSSLTEAFLEALYDGHPTKAIVEFLFRTKGLDEVAARAYRSAYNVKPPLRFLQDSIPPKEAARMWQRAFEAVIETCSIDAELRNGSPGLDRHSEIQPRRQLRERMEFLKRELSNLTIWEASQAVWPDMFYGRKRAA